jgi:hypothetical protein
MKLMTSYCSVCSGCGYIESSYDPEEWEPYYDPRSGYYGWEFINKKTKEFVHHSKVPSHTETCFNCKGTGYIEEIRGPDED